MNMRIRPIYRTIYITQKNKKMIKYGHMITCGQCMKRRENHPLWKGCGEISTRYYRNIKKGAEFRKLSFDITLEQMWEKFIRQKRKYAISGLLLWFPKTTGDLSDENASLDRIDSSKGYEQYNIQWVHKTINLLKMDLSDQEFINYCKLITKYQNKKAQDSLELMKNLDYQI